MRPRARGTTGSTRGTAGVVPWLYALAIVLAVVGLASQVVTLMLEAREANGAR
jgi:hypothetical protein